MQERARIERAAASAVDLGGVISHATRPQPTPGDLGRMLAGRLRLRFWGVRGTLPVPGYKSLKYGGNTSCVSLDLPGDELLVFDAGTGIKELSSQLGRGRSLHGRILISHPHWDHINALPFFAPLYVPGNEFQILGAAQGGLTVRDMVSAQMDGVYFPITIQEFASQVSFRDLDEGSYRIGSAAVSTLRLSHPGVCLGFRVRCEGRTLCYVTDNELYPARSKRHAADYVHRLTDFVRGADALITDTTYSDAEYRSKEGWGHSAVGQVVELAHRAEVRTLYLFHHDPDQTDEDIDRKHDDCVRLLEERGSLVECIAPKERDEFTL